MLEGKKTTGHLKIPYSEKTKQTRAEGLLQHPRPVRDVKLFRLEEDNERWELWSSLKHAEPRKWLWLMGLLECTCGKLFAINRAILRVCQITESVQGPKGARKIDLMDIF